MTLQDIEDSILEDLSSHTILVPSVIALPKEDFDALAEEAQHADGTRVAFWDNATFEFKATDHHTVIIVNREYIQLW